MDLNSLLGRLNGSSPQAADDSKKVDTSEQVHISSLALLKMLKHGRAGVPMEVMGLMLGEFVDDYTVNVVDVFAMPQSGTGVSVEAVDPVSWIVHNFFKLLVVKTSKWWKIKWFYNFFFGYFAEIFILYIYFC